MARRLVLAVAGSGKTAHLIDQLDDTHCFLVIAYTNCNVEALRNRIVRRFGFFPQTITLVSYFVFLHTICYKPFLKMKHRSTGINFQPCRNRFSRGLDRYIDSGRRLYSNRLARVLVEEDIVPNVIARLNKYFDHILVDEFQDVSGHDFNLAAAIVAGVNDVTFVGDFFQYTYATSADGNVNSSLHDDYSGYARRCRALGLDVDDTTLDRSHRCSPSICQFVSDRIGIQVRSHRNDPTEVRLVEQAAEAATLFADDSIIKLFYQSSHNYPCAARNWGECKGEDNFTSVCVVLNPETMKHFNRDTLRDLSPRTRNKLYVACTRARVNLYFVSEEMYRRHRIA